MIFENLEYIFRSFKVNNVDKGCDLGKPDKDQGSLFREKPLGLATPPPPPFSTENTSESTAFTSFEGGSSPLPTLFCFLSQFFKACYEWGFFLINPPPHFPFSELLSCAGC